MVVFWFRRDLRLKDNTALHFALESGEEVLPIFIFDKDILSALEDSYDRRVDYIYESVKAVDSLLQEVGSGLLVFNDTVLNVFDKLVQEYKITAVYCNEDYEPQALKRDVEVESFLKSKGIGFKSYKDQVIFAKDDILKADKTPYTVYTPYSVAWKKKLRAIDYAMLPTKMSGFIKQASTPIIPLESLGFKKTDLVYKKPMLDVAVISNYHLNRDIPSVSGTSGLSVALRFGTISIRECVAFALQYNEVWLNELIWREFFMQILYHFKQVVTNSFKPKYDRIEWRNNEDEFNKWCEGKTGYAIVDAGMRELNATGFMHNRVRMIVASFLVKHLLIDWRWGEAYFAQKLIDYELSSNNGNWQWAASSGCDAVPYFRIFNPELQTKRFDGELKYINKWVPEYKASVRYITPIVEHSLARERAIKTYKEALSVE